MKIPATLDLQCGKKGEQKCTEERMDAYYDDSLTEQVFKTVSTLYCCRIIEC